MAKAAVGDNYGERNTELFKERDRIMRALDALPAQPDFREREEKRRLDSALDLVKYRIVELNQGLVGDYVKHFTAHSPQLNDDLISAGTAGLISAINSYSLDRGAGFAHWAYRLIQREVLMEVRKLDHPTIGQSDFEKRPDILNAQKELEAAHPSRVITDEEVAQRAGVTTSQARRVLAPVRILSLDKTTEAGDGNSTAEFVESIPNEEASVESLVIGRMDGAALASIAQSVLTPRERFVVARRFGLDGEPPQTLASLGAALQLSRESVRNVQVRALQKLSTPAVRDRLLARVSIAQDLGAAA